MDKRFSNRLNIVKVPSKNKQFGGILYRNGRPIDVYDISVKKYRSKFCLKNCIEEVSPEYPVIHRISVIPKNLEFESGYHNEISISSHELIFESGYHNEISISTGELEFESGYHNDISVDTNELEFESGYYNEISINTGELEFESGILPTPINSVAIVFHDCKTLIETNLDYILNVTNNERLENFGELFEGGNYTVSFNSDNVTDWKIHLKPLENVSPTTYYTIESTVHMEGGYDITNECLQGEFIVLPKIDSSIIIHIFKEFYITGDEIIINFNTK